MEPSWSPGGLSEQAAPNGLPNGAKMAPKWGPKRSPVKYAKLCSCPGGSSPELSRKVPNGSILDVFSRRPFWDRLFRPFVPHVDNTNSQTLGEHWYTDHATRIVKPILTKIWKTIQKKLGKKVELPTRAEIKSNEYRAKKGLPPLKKK